ncbi:phosphatase PAP2 family protein [Massilia sp. PAMC28688]|uniref:phosphatase PAP2 family protein n=1 Tax=Massilia sp. PAMC28688 TaxID=2861283 RepID=UPI001C62CDD5|nr:phosphatase PAP2 family protein [Massilia sp. PAMC28688]QYF93841.1 phosphatase PAP2 family protein [Massilia sp. PAMC28688]
MPVTDRYPRLARHVAARFNPDEVFGLHLTLGAIALVVTMALFGLLASDVVSGAPITVLDEHLAQWFNRHAHEDWIPLMFGVTHLNHPVGLMVMSALFVAYLRRRGAHDWMAAVVLAVPGGMLLNVLLKYTFQRARPGFDEPLVQLATYSFPSGHTSGATLFYGVLAAYLVMQWRGAAARALVLLGAAVMVALVAYSRVYLGAHYLSDVLAGVAVGCAWLAICITGISTLRRRRAAQAGRTPGEMSDQDRSHH